MNEEKIIAVEAEEAEAKAKKEHAEQKSTIVHFLIKLFSFLIVLWVMFTFVFGAAFMKGETMYPKIRDGDLMFFYRLERRYNIGDVVAFQQNDIDRFARIVARAGDTVELTEDGMLKVNGNVQNEEIFFATEPAVGGIEYPYTVPEDSCFLLCDFRSAAKDSRDFGAVPDSDIRGKVFTIFRPRNI